MPAEDVLIVSIIGNCLLMLYMAVFTSILFDVGFKVKQYILFTLAGGLINSGIAIITSYYLDSFVKSITTILFGILFLKLVFRVSNSQCVVSSGLFLVLNAFSTVVAQFTLQFLGYNNIFEDSMNITIIVNVVFSIVTVVAFVLIKYFKLFLRYPKEVRSKVYVSNSIFILFTILMIAVNFGYYAYCYRLYSGIKGTGLLLISVLTLGYMIFSIINTDIFYKLESKSQELEYQVFYNKTLDTLMSNLARFKHNYSNTLNVIYAYTKMKKWEDLEKYLDEVVEQSNKPNEINDMTLLNIKNAGILGVVTSKTDYAAKQNVGMKIIILSEIKEINMKISELCEILGILMDNAIEAAAASNDRKVSLRIRKEDNIVIFEIENSVDKKVPIYELFNKGYSSKGEGRGMGLWIVKEINRKNSHVILNTVSEDHFFRQELIIS